MEGCLNRQGAKAGEMGGNGIYRKGAKAGKGRGAGDLKSEIRNFRLGLRNRNAEAGRSRIWAGSRKGNLNRR